jgi:hypothetical protein
MRSTLRVVTLLLLARSLPSQDPLIFEFHSSFWVNLHQFLYAQASDDKAPISDSAAWREALEYYRREMIRHDHLEDDMAAINLRLAHSANSAMPAVEGELALVLEKAAPEYRRRWWPQHDASNRAWIEAVRPLLAEHGAAMKREIAAAFQTTWPSEPIRTEVAVRASWAGAYTTLHPTLITISSTDPAYQGDASLEMLFHEASHALDRKVNDALAAQLTAGKLLFRHRAFGHAVLFYTAGEIARRHVTDYQPYGIRNGVLERGWPGSLAVLEKDWKPYLEGQRSFADAVTALVQDYSVSK